MEWDFWRTFRGVLLTIYNRDFWRTFRGVLLTIYNHTNMPKGVYRLPNITNEPVRSYAPGSPERAALKAKLAEVRSKVVDLPMIINGEEVRTGKLADIRPPHDHGHLLGHYHQGGKEHVEAAIEAALAAKPAWEAMNWESRAAIFLKAAELIAGPYRQLLNAVTMLGQSKNAYQAEIDCVCELADFYRFNVKNMYELYQMQPNSSAGIWDRTVWRPLEGFVFALTPFNFTSIAGNLPGAPALMGNVCVWKPSKTAVYSAYVVMKILQEAGLPDGVINLVYCSGPTASEVVFSHREFAGIHFTGSTGVFNDIWATIVRNIDKSAASRAYIPSNMWDEVRRLMAEDLAEIRTGGVEDFRNFVNAVIDEASYDKLAKAIEDAEASPDAEVVLGGEHDKTKGYFIYPTVIEAKRPDYVTMREELFGPVLTVYVYEPERMDETIELLDKGSAYALTGAIFSNSRANIERLTERLTHTAGNFYINDKPTGAVVDQQPFGGGRASGTNDKAGSVFNLLRWVSPQCIKETFIPATSYMYPNFLEE